jgi:hypothetical protein
MDVLGTFWTLVLSAVLIAGYLLLTYIRARMADRGWEKALAAKDEMIEQINDQNRELRVLTLVAGVAPILSIRPASRRRARAAA